MEIESWTVVLFWGKHKPAVIKTGSDIIMNLFNKLIFIFVLENLSQIEIKYKIKFPSKENFLNYPWNIFCDGIDFVFISVYKSS